MGDDKRNVYDILIPKTDRNGSVIDQAYHQQWDRAVRDVTGGATILDGAKGYWEDPEGNVHEEGVIPVRIACTPEQFDAILDLTIEHYDQDVIMAYRVSEHVIMKRKDENNG